MLTSFIHSNSIYSKTTYLIFLSKDKTCLKLKDCQEYLKKYKVLKQKIYFYSFRTLDKDNEFHQYSKIEKMFTNTKEKEKCLILSKLLV